MSNFFEKLVILGTGGTIAGVAASAADHVGYTAAQLSVGELVAAVPGLSDLLAGRGLQTEQVAQVDSKDMSFPIWQALALRAAHHLTQHEVRGVVITHGTDTLEETAFFLQAVLPAELLTLKPVVLVCAMRPATALAPDGPQNLLDAVAVALTTGACGVMAVCAGVVHGALDVQKIHPYRLDAFSSGDAGPLGYVEEGRLRQVRHWAPDPAGIEKIAIEKVANVSVWPRVELLMSHAGASGAMVDLLVDSLLALPPGHPERPRGLVVAGTGNGSVHQSLEAGLLRAQAAGVRVLRSSRCPLGQVLPVPGQGLPVAAGLSPVKARLALMLALLD